jgi:hypothetical protein
MTSLEEFKTVPAIVAELVPQAIRLRCAYEKIAEQTGDLAGTMATWDTANNTLVLYRLGIRPSKLNVKEGQCCILRDIRRTQPDWEQEIFIKKAAIPLVSPPFDFLNGTLGRSTPLANGVVSALMLGGLGYGAGALAENLFPERYMRRGTLRRNLGLAGAAAGASLGLNNAYATSRKMRQGFLKSLVTPNTTQVPILPDSEKVGYQFNRNFENSDSGYGTNSLFTPSVSVPQFNNAAWNDVQRGMYTGNSQFTPPAYAAAATSLMTGISAAQNSPIIRPSDVIRGIASAGVGLATANIAGRALSAMAGLTPAGQEKLQDMGLWGGMMHAIVPAIFGQR